MANKTIKSIKGRAARITRLDECGLPVYGPCSSLVTHGFISVTISHEYQAGDDYTQKNAWGELCVNEKDPDRIKWANTAIQFCEIDPGFLDIIGGANPVTFGGSTVGATFGPSAPVGAFALEVWTKKSGVGACIGGSPEWGYFVVPFVKNGKLDGDVKVENAPLNLSLTGAGYGAPADWGLGPYLDNPLLATGGFPVGDFWGMAITSVQPPAPTDGCITLVLLPVKGAVNKGDVFPADPAVTAQDATEAGQLVGEGYIVAPVDNANWLTGEFFTIGTYKFNWTGSAWAAGIHA